MITFLLVEGGEISCDDYEVCMSGKMVRLYKTKKWYEDVKHWFHTERVHKEEDIPFSMIRISDIKSAVYSE